ncbi:TniQ family protein [Gimibacter soli]|uniref:TniQ family protein n=1 Tax=Gimibacter soli TaxID=3024400 RepID=A0AAE9XL36_9PROT|nr:TniQ family protein [Gimibacter soli]WCL52883.1 TniQ family protein [Gimibacter soli]
MRFGYVPRPQPGEMLGGWLDRFAAGYEQPPGRLLYDFGLLDTPSLGDHDLDREAPPWLGAFAALAGLPLARLAAMVEPRARLLSRGNRCQICPVCWHDDLARGEEPWRRGAWHRGLALLCDRHLVPLVDCVEPWHTRPPKRPPAFKNYLAIRPHELGEILDFGQRFLFLQALGQGPAAAATIRSLESGALGDVVTLLHRNFCSFSRLSAATSMLRPLLVRTWRSDWSGLFEALPGRCPSCFTTKVETIDYFGLSPAGYRRWVLYNAFFWAGEILKDGYVPSREHVTDEAWDWIVARARAWPESEARLIRPAARAMVWPYCGWPGA